MWNTKLISYRERFERQYWCAAAQHAKPVLLRLLIEYEPARQRHNADFDALRSELARGLESDANLRACGYNRQMFVLLFVHDVAALGGQLNRRVLQIRQVLSRKGEDRWRLGGSESDEIGGRCLIAICGAPEREIGN